MTPIRDETRRILIGVAGFVLGVVAMGLLVWTFPSALGPALPRRADAPAIEVLPSAAPRQDDVASATARRSVGEAPVDRAEALPAIGADPVADLKSRGLLLPVAGLTASKLTDTFHDRRGASREHEALDILAPRNTPVLAVEDGRIAKLFTSKAGGLTIYQFDPTGVYAYYYAHLERYAPDLREGAAVTRGQHLGDVGTSGNAPPDTPHLHFAIFKLTAEKHWWEGAPIDPFDVWR